MELRKEKRKAIQVKNLRNTQEASMDQNGQQEGGGPSGPTRRPWTDSEIRIFLLEWEVVEQEVGLPGRKIHKKAKALCQRLYQRGLRKTWQSCFDLLLSLKNLHRTLRNETPGIKSLFSLCEALFRILGHRLQESHAPEPLCDWASNLLASMYLQPPVVLPSPGCHPWDFGISVSSGKPQGNSSLITSREESWIPRWDPWNPSYPLTIPHLFPTLGLGDTSLHCPWQASDDNQGP